MSAIITYTVITINRYLCCKRTSAWWPQCDSHMKTRRKSARTSPGTSIGAHSGTPPGFRHDSAAGHWVLALPDWVHQELAVLTSSSPQLLIRIYNNPHFTSHPTGRSATHSTVRFYWTGSRRASIAVATSCRSCTEMFNGNILWNMRCLCPIFEGTLIKCLVRSVTHFPLFFIY